MRRGRGAARIPCYKPGMTGNSAWAERAQKALTPNYRQQPIALVRGEGTRVWDADGLRGQRIVVDAAYVRTRLEGVATDEDLSRYIL